MVHSKNSGRNRFCFDLSF